MSGTKTRSSRGISSLIGTSRRTLQEKTGEHVSVVDFGAKGDGVTDDLQAFQDAVDFVYDRGGGGVFVPAASSYYRITSPVIMRDRVGIYGEGDGSHIYNTQPAGSQVFTTIVFVAGNWAKHDIPELDKFGCNAASVGDRSLVSTVASNASKVSPGELVWVFEDDNITGDVNVPHPSFIEANRVLSADAVTGEIEFAYPLKLDLASPVIGAYNGVENIIDDRPRFIWDQGFIRDLSVSVNDSSWLQRAAMFESDISNVLIRRGESLISGNAYNHCVISGLRGTFSRVPISVAVGSGDTVIDTVVGSQDASQAIVMGEGNPSYGSCVNLHELCRDITVSNAHITYSNDDSQGTPGYVIRLDGSYLTVRDSSFKSLGGGPSSIAIQSHEVTYGASTIEENLVENCTFVCDGTGSWIRVLDGDSTVRNNVIRGNRFIGENRSIAINLDNGDDTVISGNRFDSGIIDIETGVKRTIVENNLFGSDFSVADDGDDTLIRNNRRPSSAHFLSLSHSESPSITHASLTRADYFDCEIDKTQIVNGDMLVVEFWGEFTGTAGSKTVSFLFNSVVRESFSATTEGMFRIRVTASFRSVGGNRQSMLVEWFFGAEYESRKYELQNSYASGTFRFEFGAQVADATDAIVGKGYLRRPIRKYETE